MGFCDKCAKYRELKFFSIYIKGKLFRTGRCVECAREIEVLTRPAGMGHA